MAKATERTVQKTVNVPDGVILELTAEEARVLRHVTTRITGSNEGPRGVLVEIGQELRRAGVTTPTLNLISGYGFLGYRPDLAYAPKNETIDERPF